MESVLEQNSRPFVDRRASGEDRPLGVPERRQFRASVNTERPAVAELAAAVDGYKLEHHRRFITYEELYDVIAGLGYVKAEG
ncbi:MAG: hypothetical protein SH850_27050 [Planctomycetaceae bacterium]|nr:hypothetical protein [Planctomycetaceae bacterium]